MLNIFWNIEAITPEIMHKILNGSRLLLSVREIASERVHILQHLNVFHGRFDYYSDLQDLIVSPLKTKHGLMNTPNKLSVQSLHQNIVH